MFSYARKSVIMQYTTTTMLIYFRSNRQDPVSRKTIYICYLLWLDWT